MIYKQDANFPYPILSSTSFSYEESDFTLKVTFEEDGGQYRFYFEPTMTSHFLERLLHEGRAQYIVVIQSKDTKFFPLSLNDLFVALPKQRMSLSNRTSIQLQIVATDAIAFHTNDELSAFYDRLKSSITVPKHAMLGYSNIVTFEGGMKNPLQLFEKRLDPTLPCAIKFELGAECIIIHFRNEQMQFQFVSKGSAFLNPYLYTGLRIALHRFVETYAEDDIVDITNMTPPEDLLDFKLYTLMRNKSVRELTIDELDEVIARISHDLIEKYVAAVQEAIANED